MLFLGKILIQAVNELRILKEAKYFWIVIAHITQSCKRWRLNQSDNELNFYILNGLSIFEYVSVLMFSSDLRVFFTGFLQNNHICLSPPSLFSLVKKT